MFDKKTNIFKLNFYSYLVIDGQEIYNPNENLVRSPNDEALYRVGKTGNLIINILHKSGPCDYQTIKTKFLSKDYAKESFLDKFESVLARLIEIGVVEVGNKNS